MEVKFDTPDCKTITITSAQKLEESLPWDDAENFVLKLAEAGVQCSNTAFVESHQRPRLHPSGFDCKLGPSSKLA